MFQLSEISTETFDKPDAAAAINILFSVDKKPVRTENLQERSEG
jgi:hypothetical protein